jgi:hypothetical protein
MTASANRRFGDRRQSERRAVFSGHGSPKSPAWALFITSLLAVAALVLGSFFHPATATSLVLLSISLAAGMYAFSEGHRSMRKSVAWRVSAISALILAAVLLASYLRFVLRGLPIDW